MADNLPPKYAAAILALLTHPSAQAAADAAGVPMRTLTRWRSRPDFASALESERRRLVKQSTDHLRASSITAVATLREVMCDESCPAAVRIQAASYVLSYCYKAVELDDVVRRLDALEESQDNATRTH